jgi:hypothetical protein
LKVSRGAAISRRAEDPRAGSRGPTWRRPDPRDDLPSEFDPKADRILAHRSASSCLPDGIRDVGVASLMTDPAVDLVHELVLEVDVHTHAPNVSRKRRRRMPGALLLTGATLR